MTKISEIKGLLIDLEGVIYSSNEIIKGSVNTISKLKKNFKIRYLTNTTTTSRNSIFNKLIVQFHRILFIKEIIYEK